MAVRRPTTGLLGGRIHARIQDRSGQMMVELAVVIPVILILAVIAVNACTFFGECARFDRVGSHAVRVVAASPAAGQNAAQSAAQVESELEEGMDSLCSDVAVTVEESGGCLRFTMKMAYAPTLFGMGLRSSVFGVDLPRLKHQICLTVLPYKPGMLL